MRPGLAKAALGYFLIVFGAGFALALVRIPGLVPLLGVRWAELAEMPVMLAVIAWAAHRLVRRHLLAFALAPALVKARGQRD